MRHSICNRLIYSHGKDPITATRRDWFLTNEAAVRERLMERWMEIMRSYYESDAKCIYYLSREFLTGRLLSSSLHNMGFYDACREALEDLDLDISEIQELEQEAALGNGGLGRLAACFLDSMATRSLPRGMAMASAMSTVCSIRKSKTATQWSTPTTGCVTATIGSSHAPSCSSQ